MSRLPFRLALILCLGACLALPDYSPAADDPADQRLLVGAFYYTWYPTNFGQGYLRAWLSPAQAPALGEYDSADPEVARQHIAWCSRHGVDALIVDYFPGQPQHVEAIQKGLLSAPNIGDIKFFMLYGSNGLGVQWQDGCISFGPGLNQTFRDHFKQMAAAYFDHPSYLKINGRPVVFIYLTRLFAGDYGGAINGMRQDLETMGHDVYLIADEVFWRVHHAYTRQDTTEPQPARFNHFDAITAYNLYDADPKPNHVGYGFETRLVEDIAGLYRSYLDAAAGKVALVPNLLPGYNDRGTRLAYDIKALPRQWWPGAAEGSFLKESFDRIGLPFVDSRVNMITITSFNEWNEDTCLEPVGEAPATNMDQFGGLMTQGYVYPGYGVTYLEALRDKVCALAGRVTDAAGSARARARMCAHAGEEAVACSHSDQQGYYTLSRLNLTSGSYEVGLEGSDQRTPFTVDPQKTVLKDLTAE